jgi:membrane protein YdbS with pleckstrin-like domain
MPRRRRVYNIRIEDYLVEPPPPPSRLPRILLFAAFALLAVANLTLALGWLFSLIPQTLLESAVVAVIAYAVILTLFVAIAKGLNHVE